MLFTKVSVILAMVASAFAAPIENMERDSEKVDYGIIEYSRGKRDVENVDYGIIEYSRGKRDAETRDVENVDYGIIEYSREKRDGEESA
ncbi:hypothetical protein F5X96DRAFT_666344 [Biscogniauxia mediterranea]|nr:hypothetical protein F5X96DRAFT_666344 [Biscogniauxia mediterranea]